jgi:serine/threonine protein kinase
MGSTSARSPELFDDFQLLERIGTGAFSRVYLARHMPTQSYCAAKVINLTDISDKRLSAISHEVNVLTRVNHPNICNFYRMSVHDDAVFFFMEYAPKGTLLKLVNEKEGLSEGEARHYFIQVFSAVRHLHVHHFLVHRDLKLENILMFEKGVVKLTDFGSCGTSYENMMRTMVGTAGYQAPEVVRGGEYTEKCDIWSLGVCLFAMVSGRFPFGDQRVDERRMLSDIEQLHFPSSFSPMLVDLLKRMLTGRPDDRPSLVALQSHPWLRGLAPVEVNVASMPVPFHQVQPPAALAQFRRRKTVPRPEIVAKCAERGFDAATLAAELARGEVTASTTTYWVLCSPVYERPEVTDVAPARAARLPSLTLPKLPALNGTPRVATVGRTLMKCRPPVARRTGTNLVIRPVSRLNKDHTKALAVHFRF